MYKLHLSPFTGESADTILRIETNEDDVVETSWIPLDPDNTDYQNYLAWVAEGNTADPADPADE